MSTATAEHDDPVELMAIGEAYVGLARTHPAHCEVMFRPDLVDEDDEQLTQSGISAYEVLEGTIRRLIETINSTPTSTSSPGCTGRRSRASSSSRSSSPRSTECAPVSAAPRRDLVRSFTEIILRGADDR